MSLDALETIVVSLDLRTRPLRAHGSKGKAEILGGRLAYTSVRSVTRCATSRSPWAMTWHSRTASIG